MNRNRNCNNNLNTNFNNNFSNNCNNEFCIPYEQNEDFNQLARAFVLRQKFCGVMPLNESLVKGTAFEELYSPYKPMECKKTKMC